jgi:uncharacterized OB-fold protein
VTEPSPLIEDLFRTEGATAVLLGGRSRSTGRTHFPRSLVCPYTGADDVEAVELPPEGVLWGWTTVTSAPPGYLGEVPYVLGVVELIDGLRVVGRIVGAGPGDERAALRHGQPMEVCTDVVPDAEGSPRSVWAFRASQAPA